jgi:hypothetical protein
VGELILPASSRGFAEAKGNFSYGSRKRANRRNGSITQASQSVPKTAGWQDLVKYAMHHFKYGTMLIRLSRLVTRQSVILDTEHSLSDIVREIEGCRVDMG